MNKTITTLYDHYKNTPKKLKIICDWDEVIQSLESYALYKEVHKEPIEKDYFPSYFEWFWEVEGEIKYSPYGSSIVDDDTITSRTREKQIQIKNSPNFYQEAPFLTIAKELLKLIKEGKVSRLIFLSAYDKRKFPYGDGRKEWIFKETFDKVGYEREDDSSKTILPCYLELIGFDSETQGQTKADWIKENASDFDLVIDDNPLICKSLVEVSGMFCFNCVKKVSQEVLKSKISISGNESLKEILNKEPLSSKENDSKSIKECDKHFDITVLAPYYPAVADQHHPEVLLVESKVSGLSKEDFN
ncbi:hypothetical protein [endosymbiont GvMRE of Glomus versiforme]|uniref:hypothetical protein n=1 Tax=endosymbiont GvMRE of Glomus versiforme TaxID=2039283 RepID=UPI000EBAD79E|nr:hypothetical protein [endosymbiont GvMRE of Glomus versiforme]RHZ37712.1 Uridine/cytidine kinase [endosymbiont GvMRE of Glomus versiforme]